MEKFPEVKTWESLIGNCDGNLQRQKTVLIRTKLMEFIGQYFDNLTDKQIKSLCKEVTYLGFNEDIESFKYVSDSTYGAYVQVIKQDIFSRTSYSETIKQIFENGKVVDEKTDLIELY